MTNRSRLERKSLAASALIVAALVGTVGSALTIRAEGTSAPPAVVAATNAPARLHAFVSGKVQGVGFRNFTAGRAVTYNLRGWVKNLDDGRVEVMAEGAAPDIEKLRQDIGKGPAGARVDNVEAKDEPHTGAFSRFDVLR